MLGIGGWRHVADLRPAAAEQRGQHSLQAGDQVVGLARAFGQVFDLVVLDADLAAQKVVLALQSLDVIGRDRSRRVGTGRRLCRQSIVALLSGDIGRGRTRQVAACRARQFLDLRQVASDRGWCDHVLVAEGRLLSQAVEMTLGAIALDAPRGAGMPGMLIACRRLLDGEGILVGAGRGLSRRVGGHVLMISSTVAGGCSYPQGRARPDAGILPLTSARRSWTCSAVEGMLG